MIRNIFCRNHKNNESLYNIFAIIELYM
jgi:hypothetical protein